MPAAAARCASLADLARLGRLVAVRRPDGRVQGGRGGQRAARAVVYDLREHVPRRPVDDQPRPARTASDLLAHAQMAAHAGGRGLLGTRPHPPGGEGV